MIGFLLSLAAGSLAFFLTLQGLERSPEVKRYWWVRVFAALVMGLAMWKLTPLWTRWEVVFYNPLSLIWLNGGMAALFAGVFAFCGVVGVSLWQARILKPGTRRWPLLVPVAVGLAVVGAWALAEPLVVPRAGSNPGRAVEALVPDTGGQWHALSDWRGKVVVVNFWATWCPPCLAEIPEFRAFTKTPSDKVVVLGVNLIASETEGQGRVLGFIEDNKMGWTQLTDPDGVLQKAFEVTTIPTTVVLDPSGRVVDRREGAVDLYWLRTLEGRFGR